LEAWREGRVQLVVSAETLDEYQRVGRLLAAEHPGVDLDPIAGASPPPPGRLLAACARVNLPPMIHVVGAAIVEAGRCLVAQRGPQMRLPLQWELPGGKVEPGEDRRQALAREIEEELGLKVQVGELLGRGALPGSDGELVLDLYLAQIVGGELALTEHRQCAWVGPQELPTLDWAAADVPLLEPLRRRLEGG
jgi:8-oxo-dGTP diphosphatase